MPIFATIQIMSEKEFLHINLLGKEPKGRKPKQERPESSPRDRVGAQTEAVPAERPVDRRSLKAKYCARNICRDVKKLGEDATILGAQLYVLRAVEKGNMHVRDLPRHLQELIPATREGLAARIAEMDVRMQELMKGEDALRTRLHQATSRVETLEEELGALGKSRVASDMQKAKQLLRDGGEIIGEEFKRLRGEAWGGIQEVAKMLGGHMQRRSLVGKWIAKRKAATRGGENALERNLHEPSHAESPDVSAEPSPDNTLPEEPQTEPPPTGVPVTAEDADAEVIDQRKRTEQEVTWSLKTGERKELHSILSEKIELINELQGKVENNAKELQDGTGEALIRESRVLAYIQEFFEWNKQERELIRVYEQGQTFPIADLDAEITWEGERLENVRNLLHEADNIVEDQERLLDRLEAAASPPSEPPPPEPPPRPVDGSQDSDDRYNVPTFLRSQPETNISPPPEAPRTEETVGSREREVNVLHTMLEGILGVTIDRLELYGRGRDKSPLIDETDRIMLDNLPKDIQEARTAKDLADALVAVISFAPIVELDDQSSIYLYQDIYLSLRVLGTVESERAQEREDIRGNLRAIASHMPESSPLRVALVRILESNRTETAEDIPAEAEAETKKSRPERKESMEEIPIPEIKDIIISQIREVKELRKAEIKKLEITPGDRNDEVHLEAELDAGYLSKAGNVKIEARISNRGNTIGVEDLSIDARFYAKSRIEKNLSKLPDALQLYFEKRYGRRASRIQILDGKLVISFENSE